MTKTKNAVLSYTLSYQPLQINLSASWNTTIFESQVNNSTTMGPVISIQRPLLNKKINSSLAWSYMSSGTGENNNTTSVIRINASYKLRPKQTIKFSASGTGMKRMVTEEGSPDPVRQNSSEFRCTLNYSWNF